MGSPRGEVGLHLQATKLVDYNKIMMKKQLRNGAWDEPRIEQFQFSRMGMDTGPGYVGTYQELIRQFNTIVCYRLQCHVVMLMVAHV